MIDEDARLPEHLRGDVGKVHDRPSFGDVLHTDLVAFEDTSEREGSAKTSLRLKLERECDLLDGTAERVVQRREKLGGVGAELGGVVGEAGHRAGLILLKEDGRHSAEKGG